MSAPARHRTRLLGGLAAAFVACLLVAVGPAVLGQEGEGLPDLSVRTVDASDPQAVQASFIWTGERQALDDLVVRQDGREVEHPPPVPLATAGIETAVVVVADTSGSMGTNGGVEATQQTLRGLVDGLEGNEAMGLVSFNTEVEILSEVTTDKDELRDAIDRLAAPEGAQTSLWEGLRRGALLLEPDSELQPNIVLINDGADDQGTATAGQALSAVKASGAAVFALAYDPQQQADLGAIENLVGQTGGAVIPAPGPEDLDVALDEVRQALANQYVVTFPAGEQQGKTDLAISVGNESVAATFVPGGVSQGEANLAAPATSRSILPDFLRGDVGLLIVVAAGGIAVALAVVAVATLASKDESSLDRMLQQYTEPGTAEAGEDQGYAQTAFVQRAVELTGEIAEKRGVLVKVEAMLEQADLPLRAAEALFFYVAGATVVALLGFPLMGPIGVLIFGGLGFIMPIAVMNFLGRRRQKTFNAQLPDMLQLLAGSLRAGYSLVQGVDAVATESDGPMGRELRRAMTEARLGRELEDALQASAERVQSKDFEWVIMAIGIQREVGGNLAELLMTVSDTMIDRERLRRDVSSLTAEGKMSAIILGIMPIALGGLMAVVNPAYMEPLFTQSLGHILLGVAAATMAIGFVWMKKCITIEI